MIRILLFVLGLILFTAPAIASPLYFTFDSGLTTLQDDSFMESPTWDVAPGFEWAPAFLEKKGLCLQASYTWQEEVDQVVETATAATSCKGKGCGTSVTAIRRLRDVDLSGFRIGIRYRFKVGG